METNKCKNSSCHQMVTAGAEYCSNACRQKAYRDRKKEELIKLKRMSQQNNQMVMGLGGTEEPASSLTELQVHTNPMNPFAPGSTQAMIYQEKLNHLAQLKADNKSLTKIVEDERAAKISLEKKIQTLLHEKELALRDLKEEHSSKERELNEEIKTLNRQLSDKENEGGLNGIAKALQQPDNFREIVQAGPAYIQAFKSLINPQQLGAVPQLTQDQQELIGWYGELTPEFKESMDQLLILIGKAGPNALPLIQDIIQNYGTQFNQAAAQTN